VSTTHGHKPQLLRDYEAATAAAAKPLLEQLNVSIGKCRDAVPALSFILKDMEEAKRVHISDILQHRDAIKAQVDARANAMVATIHNIYNGRDRHLRLQRTAVQEIIEGYSRFSEVAEAHLAARLPKRTLAAHKVLSHAAGLSSVELEPWAGPELHVDLTEFAKLKDAAATAGRIDEQLPAPEW
jgi:hypothetical protein